VQEGPDNRLLDLAVGKCRQLLLCLASEAQLSPQESDPIHRLAIDIIEARHTGQIAERRG
jgi:hypothetical protein